MADGDFSLVSATGDTIDLNPLLTSDEGVQAVAGLTGFGLPPIEVLYQVGAGDGSRFRGQRSLSRDIDLPLFITGSTRAALRNQVQRLASALGDECELRWDDGERVWFLKVRRVGGGEFVYGTDLNALSLSVTITLRSETALWTALEGATKSQQLTSNGPTQVTIPVGSFGSAPSRPKFRLHGPTFGFTIENKDRSKKVTYRGFVAENDYVDIDFAEGKVTNAAGVNMYAFVAESPDFFALTPGQNAIWVTIDRTSSTYIETKGEPVATNRIGNPTFRDGTTGWQLTQLPHNGWSNVASLSLIDWTMAPRNDTVVWGSGRVTMQGLYFTTNENTFPQSSLTYDFPAGTFMVGNRYTVEAIIENVDPVWPHPYAVISNPGVVDVQGIGHQFGPGFGFASPNTVTFSFIARETGGRLTIRQPQQLFTMSGQIFRTIRTDVAQVSVTEHGTGYFDGDTADAGNVAYAWTGTPHASRSEKRVLTGEAPTTTRIEVDLNAQNWLVV